MTAARLRQASEAPPRTSAELLTQVEALRAEVPELERKFARSGLQAHLDEVIAKRREVDAADILYRVAYDREAADRKAAAEAALEAKRERARALHARINYEAFDVRLAAARKEAVEALRPFVALIDRIHKEDDEVHAAWRELVALEKQLGERLGPDDLKTYAPVSGQIQVRYVGDYVHHGLRAETLAAARQAGVTGDALHHVERVLEWGLPA